MKLRIASMCLLVGACSADDTTGAAGHGGSGATGGTSAAGSAGDGGANTTSSVSTGGGGGATGGTGGVTTSTSDTGEGPCVALACAGVDCGQKLYDCDGDGDKENHVCPNTCLMPEACQGNSTLNECGSKCMVRPEYVEACGVEWGCDATCLTCYRYVDGKAEYKNLTAACPKVNVAGLPAAKCCKNGCCTN